jgi:hypothetical protein
MTETTKEITIDLEPLVLKAQARFKEQHLIPNIEENAKVDMHQLRMLGIKYHTAVTKYSDHPEIVEYMEEEAIKGIIDLLKDTQLHDLFNTGVKVATI